MNTSWYRWYELRRVLGLGAFLAALVGTQSADAAPPVAEAPATAESTAEEPTPEKAKTAKPKPKFFDSNGVKIHYTDEGAGEPVLLIHGFTASIGPQWRQPGIIAALAPDYRVIALDNRGHGQSGKPHDPQQYGREMVEDSIRLLDHLQIETAHVVGYSMGGYITHKLLTLHPERVRSAVIAGAGWVSDVEGERSFLTELADALDRGEGLTPLIKRLTPADRPPPSEEQLKTMNQMAMLINDSKALSAVIRGMEGLQIPEEVVKQNATPALALIGEVDPIRQRVDQMAAVMPNLEVVVIPGTDHMTAFRSPEFLRHLQRFLEAHRSPAAN